MEDGKSDEERAAEKKKSERTELFAIITIVLCIITVAIAGL